MAQITHRGLPVNTCGELPAPGTRAPGFTLVAVDLSEQTLDSYRGSSIILNIFPSIDTPTCATSTKRFNQELAAYPDTRVLCVSVDLPFAQSRFCGAEGTNAVVTLSAFRNPEFGFDYGVTLIDGALRGLLARAVVVIDPTGTVRHSELVEEIGNEPDYRAALQTR